MKLFVSDLDGTLYPPNVTDSGEENRAAIRSWREAGNVFAVATARIHQSYPKVAEDLGFAVDYLGGNGAELIFSDQTRIRKTGTAFETGFTAEYRQLGSGQSGCDSSGLFQSGGAGFIS